MPTSKISPEEFLAEMARRGQDAFDATSKPKPSASQPVTSAKKPRTAKPKPIVQPCYAVMLTLKQYIPASEANLRQHWRHEHRRKKRMQSMLEPAMAGLPKLDWPLPVTVQLIRVGGRKLDRDNLARAFKATQDVIADFLDVDDGDSKSVRWVYRQRPGWKKETLIIIGDC